MWRIFPRGGVKPATQLTGCAQTEHGSRRDTRTHGRRARLTRPPVCSPGRESESLTDKCGWAYCSPVAAATCLATSSAILAASSVLFFTAAALVSVAAFTAAAASVWAAVDAALLCLIAS